jgi:hypothetical protein
MVCKRFGAKRPMVGSGGRSSILETGDVERRKRGVLDSPPSRENGSLMSVE